MRVTSAALETAMVGELRHDVGKIQGELGEIRRLSYRVSMLEQCQSWFGVHSGARSLFLTAANDASRAWPHRRSASRPLNLESLLGLIAALPGPRLVRNFPTGVSSPSDASSSTRPSPTFSDAASTPCSGTVSRCSSRAPKICSYVVTASSRSSTATPRWWIPRACTRAMLPGAFLATHRSDLATGD